MTKENPDGHITANRTALRREVEASSMNQDGVLVLRGQEAIDLELTLAKFGPPNEKMRAILRRLDDDRSPQ